MADRYFTHAILLGCMFVVFGASAGAEIVQCVDAAGAVTYTNPPDA
jgi:hypothetical protein